MRRRRQGHRGRARIGLVVAVALTLAAGCAARSSPAAKASLNAADRTFLQQMIPHHQQAIAAAQVAVSGATDLRVVSFGRRIVKEQTPELARLRSAGRDAGLDLAAGAAEAEHLITGAQLTQLKSLRGKAFDTLFLQLSITSEQGAAEMAEEELRSGHDPDVRAIAKAIAGAPSSEIPQLQKLLADLG